MPQIQPRERQRTNGHAGHAAAAAADDTAIRVELLHVTPELATKWLGHNARENRPVSWEAVEALAADISAGKWKTTHQGIAFNLEGELIDGQHRLHAIVQAGIGVDLLVAKFKGTIRDPIDQHRRRSTAFLANMSPKMIAAFSLIRRFEQGFNDGIKLTPAMAHELYGHHKDTIESVFGSRDMSSARARGGIVAAVLWAHPLAPDPVARFLVQVERGEMIQAGDPAYALRGWMGNHGRRADPWDVALVTCSALVYLLDGQTIRNCVIGEMGYRTLCARRRKNGIPFTPAANVAPSP